MLWYPVQRHRLPSSPTLTSSSVGCGFSLRRSTDCMIIPGVQKPHWRPWHSRKASCTGCSSPFPPAVAASPSMVVTSCPSAWTASTLQLFTLRPSRWTVQAPQLLVSQPITVPVFPSFSRRYCTSSNRGSTSSETCAPSTVRLILVIEALPFARLTSTESCGSGHARAAPVGRRLLGGPLLSDRRRPARTSADRPPRPGRDRRPGRPPSAATPPPVVR